MALQVYRYANFFNTYEREQFRSLCKLLNKSQDDYILVANPIIEGRELDALLIKRDAIIVLEFKNYSGGLSASEFGDWHIVDKGEDEIIVKGGFGKRNPYGQVLQNRWCTINKFNSFSSPLINAYHTAGLVVFNGEITKEKYDFSGKVRSWFHITDMNHVIEKIENITSDQINFNDALWNEIPNFLNVADYLWTGYDQASLEGKEENVNHNARGGEAKTDEQDMVDILRATGFKICHKRVEEKREAVSVSYDKLNLSKHSLTFLKSKGIPALWKHQANAIEKAKEGNNVCITTSTSSGKTEIFQILAIEVLEKSSEAKVLAVYPMKALNRQQVERWEKTGFPVGKIDGDIHGIEARRNVLRQNRIVVMTPDVMHTFLLGKLNDNEVGTTIKNFIKNLQLIIIDELHLYKGLFGTNSAYLFRRLNNVRRLLRKENDFAQYVTASATLPEATIHSFNITGVEGFIEIGVEQDGSPMSKKTYLFVERDLNAANDENGLVGELVRSLPQIWNENDDKPKYKSITFVDGRQRTGEIVNRLRRISDNPTLSGIYPYRAGYENNTVDIITEHLHDGNFSGIVCTSALEIGIDIDGLNVAIIADMPHDKNSYEQRIGRVGRYGCENSFVIIIRTGSFASQLLFDEYNYDINKVLPNYEPALYLDDENVQSVHALCHVGDHENAEYNQWKGGIRQDRNSCFDDGGCFPLSFVELCRDVLTSQAEGVYLHVSGEDIQDRDPITTPHYVYPLRFFGRQYKIVASRTENQPIPEEFVSREQLSSEGYEGAIRNTMFGESQIKERVIGINVANEEVIVKREHNNYISTESYHRKFVIPNFKKEFRSKTLNYDKDTYIYNLTLNEFHHIYGYYEIVNRIKQYHSYEATFQIPKLITTGTVIFHPSFNKQGVQISDIALILFETFLRRNAFDRNDINYLGGRLFTGNEKHDRGDKFIAIYDVNSLNITSRIAEVDLLKDMFGYLLTHKRVIARTICPNINDATMNAIESVCKSIIENEPETSYKDVGKEKEFRPFTEVIYLEEDDENPESYTEKRAMFTGKGNIELTLNVIVDGRPLPNVPIDRIRICESTEYDA